MSVVEGLAKLFETEGLMADPSLRALPRLAGLGTAVPPSCWSQAQAEKQMAELWGLNSTAMDRWHRIVMGTNIDNRHAVVPVQDIINLSTAARMVLYEQHAPMLAGDAAQRAMSDAGITPGQVTDLIVVSCTGFSAPGVDAALVQSLGLSPAVRRTLIGFMGCNGAINGLRTAVGACCANPGAVALVVCVELCSLHMRPDDGVQNQVASALFADGAAAAVLISDQNEHDHGTHINESAMRLTTGDSLLIPEGAQWMTWRVTDMGFAMTLDRAVPVVMRQRLSGFVRKASSRRPNCFVIHPGGPGIIDAADAALELRGGRGLECSREILRRYGNMSSATVLFVLQEALRLGYSAPFMMLAFGPGLTIESLQLLPVESPIR